MLDDFHRNTAQLQLSVSQHMAGSGSGSTPGRPTGVQGLGNMPIPPMSPADSHSHSHHPAPPHRGLPPVSSSNNNSFFRAVRDTDAVRGGLDTSHLPPVSSSSDNSFSRAVHRESVVQEQERGPGHAKGYRGIL